MLTKKELRELLKRGENSGLEFKRDDVHPESLAKEIVALANFEGGYIVLGVEDNGAVAGITRDRIEEWVMEICRTHVQPSLIPFFELISWDQLKKVAVVTIPPDCPDKPYKARSGGRWITFIRSGSTSREATRDEEQRLYQSSGLFRYELKPVPGATIKEFDFRRLENYFKDVRRQECPPRGDLATWETLLVNTEIMTEYRDLKLPTVGGLLLFGRNPNRYLPQAGITAVAYPGPEKEYAARERAILRGPVVPLLDREGEPVENGLIDQAMAFVKRNIGVQSWIDEHGRRRDRWDYPLEAIREAIVNAVAHRDYTISGTDIEISIYTDRLEVISPGKLPNTVTIERMKAGCRYTRNELIKEVLRDYQYVEATGLGVPRKIIAGMRAHNGTEPDLIEEEFSFTVRLWKQKKRG